MSENQQPERKTWTMLKIAKPEIPFNENIFPFFTSNNPVTDEWGTWSLDYNSSPSNTPAFRVFDESDSLWWCVRCWDSSVPIWVEIQLPEGYGICPYKMTYSGEGKTISLLGYDPIEEKYDTLYTGKNGTAYVKDFIYSDPECTKYYTRFRISCMGSYGYTVACEYCKCLSGKIKKL